jgi:predicted nuclease with TOPRIM domain
MQTKKLEEENRTLKDGAHTIANTKLAEVERENASLRAKAKEQEEVIVAVGSKLEILSLQKMDYEEQNRSLIEANRRLEAHSNHLEQKVIEREASIQNIMQVQSSVWGEPSQKL